MSGVGSSNEPLIINYVLQGFSIAFLKWEKGQQVHVIRSDLVLPQ